jgi:hypothetical protein
VADKQKQEHELTDPKYMFFLHLNCVKEKDRVKIAIILTTTEKTDFGGFAPISSVEQSAFFGRESIVV